MGIQAAFGLLAMGLAFADGPAPGEGGCAAMGLAQAGLRPDQILRRSPNPALNAYIDANVKFLTIHFAVQPRYYFFDDGPTPNSWALRQAVGAPGDFPPEFSQFGSVLLGVSHMTMEFNSPRSTAMNYSYPTVMAHEWGHVVQNRRSCRFQGMARELMADYLAGWHIRYLQQKGIAPDLQEAEVFARVYAYGDWFDPSHHGTPRQRLDAIAEGYENEMPSIGPAYDAATRYIEKALANRPAVGAIVPAKALEIARRWEAQKPVGPRLGVTVLMGKGGMLVDFVKPGGPGEQAGLRVGDTITEVNAVATRNLAQLREGATRPPANAVVTIRRADGAFDRLTLGQPGGRAATPGFGATVSADGRGVLIQSVAPDSPAARGDLRPGDVITAVNGRAVHSGAELDAAVGRALDAGRGVVAITFESGKNPGRRFTMDVGLSASSAGRHGGR